MAFLDNLKEVPQNSGSGGGKYMKLQQGSNLFRILGSFEDGTNIQGMLGWAEDEEGNRKPFRKLRQDLLTLAKDEDWGDPRKYDLKIVRNGEGLETSYAMTPSPHKKLAAEIIEAFKNTTVDMSALYRGEDPFAESAQEEDAPEEDPF